MAGMTTKVVVVVLGAYLVTPAAAANFFSTMLMYEVASSHNDPFAICSLGSVDMTVPSRQLCAGACLKAGRCRAFCVNGTMCYINAGYLNSRWPGAEVGGLYPAIYTYDYCYSVKIRGEVSSRIKSVSSSSIFNVNEYPPELAVNGFYCHEPHYHGPLGYCFIGALSDGLGWWKAELDSPQTVSTIILWTRGDNHSFSMFTDVEITFGNSDDYNNPTFDSYSGSASPAGEVITFKASSPMTGQYLQVKDNSNDGRPLAFCHIQLLA